MMWCWVGVAMAGSSALWGEAGELWDPTGRLPDYSYAGYRAGEVATPDPPTTVMAADFGVVADGLTDDTAALQAAIDAAVDAGGGVVEVGPGAVRLTDVVLVQGDVLVRGAGQSLTTLAFEVALADVRGESQSWSWSGGLLWFQGPGVGDVLATVGEGALRGDDWLAVDDSGALSTGALVVLELTGGPTTLGRHLHNELADAGDCTYQDPFVVRWPVRLAAVEAGRVQLAQPLRIDANLDWTPVLRRLDALREVGVEDLTIGFPDTEYPGHLDERGYNGLYFAGGAVDGWVRRVTFDNADNGLLLDPLSKHFTVSDLRHQGREGHHGLNFNGAADVLVQDLWFDADQKHALTVDHKTNGCVFRRVAGADPVEFDHHKDASFENLFTDIQAETSWWHGGSECGGPPSGARETFWNVGLEPLVPPYWGWVQANVIGPLNYEERLTEDDEWYEDVDALEPRDLYRAQRLRRLGLPDTGLDGGDSGAPDAADSGDAVGPSGGAAATGCGCGGGSAMVLWLAVPLVGWRRGRDTSGG